MAKKCQNMSSNARERVEDLYRIYPQPRTFEEDVAIHRLTGVVIEGEDFFLMARGVKHDAGYEALSNPEVNFAREVQDCWFLYAFSGPLTSIYAVAPYYLPLVCFGRRGTPGWHFYRLERLQWRVARLARLHVEQ
jgi:hypothetical protein